MNDESMIESGDEAVADESESDSDMLAKQTKDAGYVEQDNL